MNYYIDLEFVEWPGHVELVSLGMVDENDNTFYAEDRYFNDSHFDKWHEENVRPGLTWIGQDSHIIDFPVIKTYPNATSLTGGRKSIEMYGNPGEIAREILLWIGTDTKPRFYSYYADYDWVCFAQIFGRMVDLPKHFPMYCIDLKQLLDQIGNPRIPNYLRPDEKDKHNAMHDAHFHKRLHQWIKKVAI